MHKYPWVGITRQAADARVTSVERCCELFQHAEPDLLSVGGGGGHALSLDSDLRFGRTERCQTFENPSLCPAGEFEAKVVEVYGLKE